MTKQISVKTGDLFLIPWGDKYAVCKVLWISKRTRNVFSFIVKSELADTTDEAWAISNTKKNISVKIYSGTIRVFYTSIEKLKKGEWEIIGNQELTEEEMDDLKYHNIGGNLYKGDEYIRGLSVEEYETVPKMSCDGYEAINNFLKTAFTD